MRQSRVLLRVLGAVMLSVSTVPLAGDEGPATWIDLTYAFSPDTVYWPTSDPFQLETVFAGRTGAGFYYSAYKFATAEHGGTHLDAPIHFGEGQPANHEIPLERLIGDAVVVDVSARALSDRDYLIQVADLTAWEREHGPIPPASIVLLRTGYGRFWPDPDHFARREQRVGMRFQLAGRVTADHAGGSRAEVELVDQRDREAFRLVGDNAPFEPPLFDPVEQRFDAGEQASLLAEVLLVVGEELFAHRGVVRVVGADAETRADEAPRAHRRHGPRGFDRQRRQAARGAHAVQCVAQVRRGVGKGSVEIEEYGFYHGTA